jgi:hypothetical protein
MNTYDNLDAAMARHHKDGGYLLDLGGVPKTYMVCDECTALDMRSVEQLASLAPTYSEAQQ